MDEPSEPSREWLLTWARSGMGPPEMFHPLADEFANIEQREIESDIAVGTPVLIDPDGGCDVRLSRFFLSPHFARLRESTKKSYALDLRLWIEYLDSRAKGWSDATPDDVGTYWLWRSRYDLNKDAVGGSKVNRELAAISLLYRWASHPSRGHVAVNPVERESLYGEAEQRVRSKNVVRQRVKWLTPRTVRLWRDLGLDGYGLDGQRDGSFRGRTAQRNKAMVELLYGSGLRITEASSLLLPELPARGFPGAFNEAQLSAAMAKGRRPRTWYLLDDASSLVNGYVSVTRRAAVESARRHNRYDSLLTIEVSEISVTTHQIRYKFGGRWHDHDNVGIAQRRRMYVNEGNGPEPLWLWLNESGTPMSKDSWTDVLDAANERVEKLFKVGRRTGQLDPNAGCPRLSPHSLRHSFALFMLIALHRSIDARRGSDHVTDYDDERYREAWDMVRDLLGHAHVTTTKEHYLSPLNGVRLRSLIDGDDLRRALRGLSQLDPRVLDVEEVS